MNIIIVNKLKQPVNFTMPLDVEKHDWLGTGRFGTWLVPDYIFNCSLKKAGCIHDKMYELQYPKTICDATFYYNMVQLIKQHFNHNLIFKQNAIGIAKVYYYAVDKYGKEAYDNCGKNKIL